MFAQHARTRAPKPLPARRLRYRSHSAAIAAAFGLMLSGCGGGGGGTDQYAAEGADAHEEGVRHQEGLVHLSEQQAAAAGIRIEQAASTGVSDTLDLPAEVRFDPDRLARVSVPISGVVTEVRATEGGRVKAGQILAVIASRELADLKSDYLDALSAENLARREAEREEILWKDQATSEASVQTRRAALARATASREAAETKLHAIDIGHDVLDNLVQSADGSRANFQLRSPLAGEVVQRDATIGEAVGFGEDAEKALFVLADASVVWADIAIFRQDFGRVRTGQTVTILGDGGDAIATSKVTYISPVIDPASRTSTARVVLDNAAGRLRPGQFVTARLETGASTSGVTVAQAAVQSIDGAPVVFVPHEEGFVAKQVAIGRTSAGRTEILSGLAEGERYVAEGAFTLKSEMEKSAFGDGHAH